MVTKLAENWSKCGIQLGDIVLIHSSLSRTLKKYNTSPHKILESLLEAVGPTGTMLFPLFNFDFTKGVPFDIRSTPSQMGVLTETSRQYPNAVRSGHPIYSFAAIGANAHLFNVDNFSGYGSDSPFAILREIGGKIAVLDLSDLNSMTFYHYIEEMHDVPYRYHKKFTGNYTDIFGVTTKKTYGLFVRDLEKGVLTDVNNMGEILWEQGLYSGSRPNEGIGLRTISARDMYASVAEIIKSNRAYGLLYSIEEKS
jgi:aminoglycoside 3-N-acetyltransferase